MSINPDKAIGYEAPTLPVAWTQKDLLLYHAGIGGKKEDLKYLYELDPNWQPFPTYPLVLRSKGANYEIQNFVKMKESGDTAPGLPRFEPTKGVHAEQSIEVIRPIPKSASEEDGFHLTKRCVGALDKGRGTIIEWEINLVDKSGTVYSRMITSGYSFVKDGLNGYQKSIRPRPPVGPASKLPDRAPDAVVSEKTSDEQALLYRLSSDTNPLHADPEIGKKIGFGGVILHGLCSYGFCARSIIRASPANNDGTRFKYMYGRFSSPVRPGETLETNMWFTKVAEGTKIDFIQKVKDTGKTAISNGVALVLDQPINPKL